jgi:uncharacterized protein YijF (DUF1287 family)
MNTNYNRLFLKSLLSKIVLAHSLFFLNISMGIGQVKIKDRFADSALTLIQQRVAYDGRYFAIDYPNGDVPPNKGVCTDVVIRAFRKVGIDLQRKVHEDMKSNFSSYPKIWGLKHPDKNIDHRRVPNLMVFFQRHGLVLPITNNPKDYVPGDIVCWDLGNSLTHIGIVVKTRSRNGIQHLIVHNIGAGQVVEDCLFKFKIIGHYQYPRTN